MKKIILLSALLLVFALTTGTASARVFIGFGPPWAPVVVGPPVVAAPPPAYYPYSYPYAYYGPGYYGYRGWFPGYWGGWGRAWHRGHWYRR